MNCGVCSGFLTVRSLAGKPPGRRCTGCRIRPKMCAYIKGQCALLSAGKVDFCFECPDFPCRRLQTLDRRYVTRYNTSLIANLRQIQAVGVAAWLAKQAALYTCPACGGTISIHDSKCYGCGRVRPVRTNIDTVKP